MDYERFITVVAQGADLSWEDAERATRATLETLAERISSGEARQLAAQLPSELSPWLSTLEPAEGFDVDELLRRVADREDVDVPTAERHVRAVFAALTQAVTRQELHDLLSELPKDIRALVGMGPEVEIVGIDTFLQRVVDRTGLDRDGALRATEAVLETLAERISHGEVEDLIADLPVELHEALRRGDANSNGAATRFDLDEFVHRVAEREGVTRDEARDHARAVFAALREALPGKEFFDVTDQLPDDYAVLLAR
jgi:uncharacterized protein (DUF2267 family)